MTISQSETVARTNREILEDVQDGFVPFAGEALGEIHDPMTEAQRQALRELRHAGYAVITWTPSELGTANPRRVEDRSIEFGFAVIEDLK